MKKMATKSFTTEMTFDKKSVNSLIKALNNEKSPNRKPVKNVEIINNPDTIRKILGKKQYVYRKCKNCLFARFIR